MTDDTPASNRKAPDRLADVREKIRILKSEEATIRQGLIDGSIDLEGDTHVAVVATVINEKIDFKRMREHVEESVWAPYLIKKETVYVNMKRKA